LYICIYHSHLLVFLFFFFFQAEDGIRDRNVTGVQTCALPIYRFYELINDIPGLSCAKPKGAFYIFPNATEAAKATGYESVDDFRSEERRVGKECRSRWWTSYEKKKMKKNRNKKVISIVVMEQQ